MNSAADCARYISALSTADMQGLTNGRPADGNKLAPSRGMRWHESLPTSVSSQGSLEVYADPEIVELREALRVAGEAVKEKHGSVKAGLKEKDDACVLKLQYKAAENNFRSRLRYTFSAKLKQEQQAAVDGAAQDALQAARQGESSDASDSPSAPADNEAPAVTNPGFDVLAAVERHEQLAQQAETTGVDMGDLVAAADEQAAADASRNGRSELLLSCCRSVESPLQAQTERASCSTLSSIAVQAHARRSSTRCATPTPCLLRMPTAADRARRSSTASVRFRVATCREQRPLPSTSTRATGGISSPSSAACSPRRSPTVVSTACSPAATCTLSTPTRLGAHVNAHVVRLYDVQKKDPTAGIKCCVVSEEGYVCAETFCQAPSFAAHLQHEHGVVAVPAGYGGIRDDAVDYCDTWLADRRRRQTLRLPYRHCPCRHGERPALVRAPTAWDVPGQRGSPARAMPLLPLQRQAPGPGKVADLVSYPVALVPACFINRHSTVHDFGTHVSAHVHQLDGKLSHCPFPSCKLAPLKPAKLAQHLLDVHRVPLLGSQRKAVPCRNWSPTTSPTLPATATVAFTPWHRVSVAHLQ